MLDLEVEKDGRQDPKIQREGSKRVEVASDRLEEVSVPTEMCESGKG